MGAGAEVAPSRGVAGSDAAALAAAVCFFSTETEGAGGAVTAGVGAEQASMP